MTASETIDCASYHVTDSYFGAPYIDVDEWRDTPLRYRHVHGGFADCDTNKLTNGCEITTTNDVNNCGGCSQKCGAGGALRDRP